MFVVNVDWFFLSHRLPIALGALANGFEVHIACCLTDRREEMEKAGLVIHPLTLVRGKASAFSNVSSFLEILSLFRRVRPDIVHLVTIKPVLFGSVAARLAGIRSVVAAISGLGFIFINPGVAGLIQRAIVGLVYRFSLAKTNLKVIFQNFDDRDMICHLAHVPASKVVMICGSGVDLDEYSALPRCDGVPVVMLAARLLRDKGVMEFVEAAGLLQAYGCQARFCLVGEIDPDNPASLTAEDMTRLKEQRVVEAWGQSSNMAEVLRAASIVVLPSYREGFPKVLLEAAACGRAVITTDVPGCRDAIKPGVSGLLVPPRDAAALAEAIGTLLDDPERCTTMGCAGRILAEREFNVAQVVNQHLDIYRELEANA